MRCLFILLGVWATAIPMGEQEQTSIIKEPTFIPLEEGEDIVDGKIIDEQTVTEVTQLSFGGVTEIGIDPKDGIRREDNDSSSTLNLSNTQSIKVIQHLYASKRYPEREFSLIQKTSLDGTVTDGLLVPRHVLICGIEKKTGAKISWYFNKIDELIIDHPNGEPRSVSVAPKNLPAPAQESIPPAVVQQSPRAGSSTVVQPEVSKMAESVSQAQAPLATVKDTYKEMEVRVVEKAPEILNEKKTVLQAATDVVSAIIDLVKALFGFIKNLFW